MEIGAGADFGAAATVTVAEALIDPDVAFIVSVLPPAADAGTIELLHEWRLLTGQAAPTTAGAPPSANGRGAGR